MPRILFVPIAVIALACSAAALAQDHDHMDHRMHMAGMAAAADDGRQAVAYPPEMREHTLADMRQHMQALSDILAAMAAARYTQAAQIAAERLGMNSPAAAGCKGAGAAGAPEMSLAPDMEHQMSQLMPEGMRQIGLEMHQAASAFAAAATKAGKTGKARPALAALSRVTQQCGACHAAYKLQ